MAFDVNALRHPKERIYGALMLWIGALVWLAVAAGAVLSQAFRIAILPAAIYLVVIWLVLTIARVLIRAHMFGHHVLVGPDQFPHIHAMVEEGARRLGLAEAPMTFVYNSQGVMNAFALRLIGKQRYVWIASALIDADTDEQLRFVIGHELGHHVAGHLDALPHVVRLAGFLIPALGPAYSRARELTCDRI
ncbi:M48 family metallopeptidase [Microvirga antarctica]|uniref:M48 family metallopeptidase n=1 Tax=Microvirga antarctica TaxID=2819233 RepID=UPI001B318218|nr:M48 family metallopeptidase [Microvirga antarctica]